MAGSAPGWRETALRSTLWLLLGGWLGAWLCFATVVAPTAFRVLPSRELAAALVGPVLATLHLYGACAGLALGLLALALRRGAGLSGLPLLLGGLCLYSHFGVSGEMDEIRGAAFGPEGRAELAARFADLHRISVAIYAAVGLGALALLGLHARADARAGGARGETPPSRGSPG
jgi:hypothetical protein